MDNADTPPDLFERLASGRRDRGLLRGRAPLEMSEEELAAVRQMVERGAAVPAIFVRALLARLDRAEARRAAAAAGVESKS